MRNTKGVSAILEQVFILLFGVLILITVVVTFSQLKDDTVEYSAAPQFETVAQQVQAAIAVAQRQMSITDFGYVGFSIPAKIAGADYAVRINNTHIRVENFQNTINKSINLANMGVSISGSISSNDAGKLRAFFNASDRSIKFTKV